MSRVHTFSRSSFICMFSRLSSLVHSVNFITLFPHTLFFALLSHTAFQWKHIGDAIIHFHSAMKSHVSGEKKKKTIFTPLCTGHRVWVGGREHFVTVSLREHLDRMFQRECVCVRLKSVIYSTLSNCTLLCDGKHESVESVHLVTWRSSQCN